MLKVNLWSEKGKETALVPEYYTVEKVLDHFQVCSVGLNISVNGIRLGAGGFDRELRELSDGAEVCIEVFPDKGAKETDPVPAPIPAPMCRGLSGIKAALLKAKEALEEAIKAVEEEELPF